MSTDFPSSMCLLDLFERACLIEKDSGSRVIPDSRAPSLASKLEDELNSLERGDGECVECVVTYTEHIFCKASIG